MNKKEQKLLNTFPKFEEHLESSLQDSEFAKTWLDEALAEYSTNQDINELIISLKPLIEANYTICDFAQKIGLHRITLYKIFSRKMVPSIEVLNKIFNGLGFELLLNVKKA